MNSGGRYESWIGGLFQHRVPARRPVLTRRRTVIAAVSVLTWVVVLLTESVAPALRTAASVALTVASFAGLVIWINTWSNVIERAHARLVSRPDLGDLPRVLVFFVVLVGYGVVSTIVAGLALWLLAH